jgi:glycolate oxidase
MSIEMVDQLVLSGMNSYLSRLSPKIVLKIAKAALLVRLDGDEKATANYANHIKNMLLNNQHASDVKILSGIEHEYVWKARDGAGPSLLRLTRPGKNPSSMIPAILDFSVPYSKIYTLMEEFGEIMRSYNLVFTRMGHLGDGNVHLISSVTLKSKADIQKMGDLQEQLVELAASLGGSVSAEHGCGIWKAPYFNKLFGEDVVEIMRKIKSIFDPNNVLNPGKMYSIHNLAMFSNKI